VRFAGAHVPYPRHCLDLVHGYAIAHNVGLNTLSAGGSLSSLSALGLGAKQIATIIAFGTGHIFIGRRIAARAFRC